MSRTSAPRRVTALGGGHGLSATLEAAISYADSVTAVVSIADDGGSSGRIREAIGGGAPGDLRMCLGAMASNSLLADALGYRFVGGELEGHAVGNLLLAGLAQSSGDLIAALDEMVRLLDLPGRVLPATTSPVHLIGHTAHATVEGQVAVSETSNLERVSYRPDNPVVPGEVLEAIADADQLLVGPGSLFTSVIATVAIPSIRDALAASKAKMVYVANLAPQAPEAADLTVSGHVEALEAHAISPDIVLADSSLEGFPEPNVPTVYRRVACETTVTHDPKLLAAALWPLW